MNRLVYVLILLGVGLILYLSWQPHPNLRHTWFIPKWLSDWTDKKSNGNLRTSVPFLMLGLLVSLMPVTGRRPWYWWVRLWVGMVGLVTLSEAVQIFIPTRFPSWEDIGWGSLGAFVGLVISYFIVRLRYYFR
ncbi:VanZ family protein [Spirosoma harenae]